MLKKSNKSKKKGKDPINKLILTSAVIIGTGIIIYSLLVPVNSTKNLVNNQSEWEISTSKQPEREIVKIPGVDNMQPFPFEIMVLDSSEKGKSHLRDGMGIFRGKNGFSLKVIIATPKKENGVWLIDSKGLTLASKVVDLYTSEVDLMPMVIDPVSGDFNRDGKTDFCVIINIRGAGSLTDGGQYVFFLSNNGKYVERDFNVTHGGNENIVKFRESNACYIIVRKIFETDIDVPVHAPEEMPAMDETPDNGVLDDEAIGQIASEYKMSPAQVKKEDLLTQWHRFTINSMLFYLSYPVKISGTDFIVENRVNKAFPVIESFGRWGGGSKGETKLLTKEQKQKLWKDNIAAIMSAGPIINKEFISTK